MIKIIGHVTNKLFPASPLPHESSREVVKKKRKVSGSSWLKDNPGGYVL